MVTSQSSFSSSDAAVLSTDSSRLRSLSAGSTTLQATFDGNSVTTTVEVSDTSVGIADAVLMVGGSISSYSFEATRGSTVQAAVSLTFDDGTQFSDAASASTLDWFPLSTLLNFSSADPSKVMVDSAGTLTLAENHYRTVDVATTAVCSGLSDVLPWQNVTELPTTLRLGDLRPTLPSPPPLRSLLRS